MKLGTKKEYVLFLDESGKSELKDAKHQHFLLSYIIMEKELHESASNIMISSKRKANMPQSVNIHAFDYFENEKFRNDPLNIKDLEVFYKNLVSLIYSVEYSGGCYIVDKSEIKKKVDKIAKKYNTSDKVIYNYLKGHGHSDILYQLLSAKIFMDFAQFLEKNDAYGEIIIESRRGQDKCVHDAYLLATENNKYNLSKKYSSLSQSAFDRISTLTFQNKKGESFGLEMADLFAWSMWNKDGIKRVIKIPKSKEKRILGRLNQAKDLIKRHKVYKYKEIKITIRSKLFKSEISKFINCLNYFGINHFGDRTRNARTP